MTNLPFLSKKRILGRLDQLTTRRGVHLPDWRRITDVIRPARGNYLETGEETSKRPTSMVNSTPAVASRTLQAGMISGASSPAYEWFKFLLDDKEMMKWGPARVALEERERIVRDYLARSNFYQSLQTVYGDAADFGTGAGIINPHPRDVFTAKVFAPGEYVIDVDDHGDIDTLMTDTNKTAFQLISRFGDRVSQKVRDAYDNGNYGTPFRVVQAIEPNLEILEGRADWRGKPWVKFIFERSVDGDSEDKFLEISGYEDWPGFDLRWDVASGNIWGWGCGILALGDAASLQTLEFRFAQGVEKGVKPPLTAPSFLKNQPISHAPGGVTYYDPFTANATKVEPIYEMVPGILNIIDQRIQNAEYRINEVYFKDLFLMLATTDRREITAREVEEKHQEKLLGLGPVLQRTHRDTLSNSIIRVYKMLDAANAFPPAPPELRSREITIRYTSALAFAQRAAGASSLERFFGFTGNIAAAYPAVRHKINVNKGMDYYADAIGVPAEIMVPDKVAEKAAAEEAQAAQLKERAGAVRDSAQGLELLSRTDTSRPSALSYLLDRGGLS